VSEETRTDKRIAALLERVQTEAPALLAEVDWLVQRYRRLDRNLEKISRMSDRMQAQILDLNDQLRQASLTDPLTGLANRRGAHEALEARRRSAGAEGPAACCVVLFDIDHFKSVNDRFGHDVGDEVLVDFAARLNGALGPEDLSARWGGEEFLVVLNAPDAGPAAALLDKFLQQLRDRPVKTAIGPLPVTASAGLCLHPAGQDDFNLTVFRADQALYAAKGAGRDRWQEAPPLEA
jgi:diguanylate cyclase (GGDEF)-like protein